MNQGELQRELEKLNPIDKAAGKEDLILMGDFNFRIGKKDENDEGKLKAIANISNFKDDPFIPLLLNTSMISTKKDHCNDSIMARRSVLVNHALKGGFYVIEPKGAPVSVGGYSVMREKDFKRSTFGLFTDHYPVAAIFCADEIPDISRLVLD